MLRLSRSPAPLTARRVRWRHTIDGDRQRGGLEDDLDVLLGRGRLQGEANDDLRLAVLAGLLISAEERRQWVSCDVARRCERCGVLHRFGQCPATHLYFLPPAPPSTSPAFLAARSAWFFWAACCSGLPPMPPMFAIIEAMSSMLLLRSATLASRDALISTLSVADGGGGT